MNDLTLQYRICFTTLKYGWMDWWKSFEQQRRFLEVRVLNYVLLLLITVCIAILSIELGCLVALACCLVKK